MTENQKQGLKTATKTQIDPKIEKLMIRADDLYGKIFGAKMPDHVRECLRSVFESGRPAFTKGDTGLSGYTAVPLLLGLLAAQVCKPYTLVTSNLYQHRALIAIRNNPKVLTATKRRYLTVKIDA